MTAAPHMPAAMADLEAAALAAERFGTPCYVYDGGALERQYLGIRTRLDDRMSIYFSLKSNPNISIIGLLHALGARAEVSSLVELVTARRAGVPASQILFLGPGKSREELEACLDEGVRAIICESFDELAVIDALAAERGVAARVVLRVNASFEVKGSGLTMGGKPRQFGIDEEQLLAAHDLVDRHPNVHLIGVQAYMGTRILREQTVIENTERILELAERLAEAIGFDLELVDVGGGLGIAYFKGEQDLDIDAVTAGVNAAIADFAARRPGTELVMELGRYLVAGCGTYVTRVRSIKESRGERFAVADGGTNHHMAAIGIGSVGKRNFPMSRIGRTTGAAPTPWNVTGPLCTPNDTIGKAVALPEDLAVGDLVAVHRSGAYGPTASPVHFLSHGYPAEVLIADGEAVLVRRRDRVDDLLAGQYLHRAGQEPVAAAAPLAATAD